MLPCCHFFFVLIAGREGSPVCFQPHLSGEQCRGSGVLQQLHWTCSTGHGLSITQKNSHPADHAMLRLTGNKGSWHWSYMKRGWSLPLMQSTGRRRQWGLYVVCQCTFYSCLWFQCCFMSTETIMLIRDWGSPGQPPRLSHGTWALNASSVERVLHILGGGLEHSGSTQEVSAFLYAFLHRVIFVAVGYSIGGICSLHGAAQKDQSWCSIYSPQKKGSNWKGLRSSGEITGELFSGCMKMMQMSCTTRFLLHTLLQALLVAYSGNICVWSFSCDESRGFTIKLSIKTKKHEGACAFDTIRYVFDYGASTLWKNMLEWLECNSAWHM